MISQNYKTEFIEFLLDAGVLKFGDFIAKSGRKLPYFINAGDIKTGKQIERLGEFYAQCYLDKIGADKNTVLYGPAYKGIPIAVAAASALAKHDIDVPFFFNRKEAKDHGEGGTIVGAPLKGRVIVIDDVISAGTSVRESVRLIEQAGATPCGVLIALDRMEKGGNAVEMTETSAVQDVEKTFNMPVVSIMNLKDLLAFMDQDTPRAKEARQFKEAVTVYREKYGKDAEVITIHAGLECGLFCGKISGLSCFSPAHVRRFFAFIAFPWGKGDHRR